VPSQNNNKKQQQKKRKKKRKKRKKNSTRQLRKILRAKKAINTEPIKGTVHPIIYHKGIEGEQMYN
jgi:hypothetical protein